ncbi:DUF2716 domain-containing protein [Subtercola endophyticus]|uniref:DUF2716 domain-containing protein n=1 Tax=Subtercola endophyticus TaxID=2895559 RepID=UPI001E38EBEF|nr:DUF2716 domain-containing protein [Subtercola endophyticus]UFS57638.1 DUF2716 domain-containing protein [Subtercola endophyticus]
MDNRPGWRALQDPEYKAVWDQFYERFQFRAGISSADWPGIREPTPSITFDLFGIVDRPRLASAVQAINSEALRCFIWEMPDIREMLVLDWQHSAYWLNPAVESLQPPDDPINGYPTVHPDGDYYSFLSPDMREGTFGHPWERTICVMGDRLINSLGTSFALWLPVLRINGEPING